MSQAKRVVIKIGSQVLCKPDGELNVEILADLVRQISSLREQAWQVLLISSGAVAAGQAVAAGPLENISDPVARKQVMAATGQVRLMETYRGQFHQHGLVVAQVLASKADFQTRRHYLNMRGCIEALLSAGIVPIVNENDVVAVTELMFTDNDELAGLLAGMVNADRLCLLSTVPGVYDGDPGEPGSHCIETWDETIHKADELVQRGTSALGRGGMHSKLAIARKTAQLGTEVFIADGKKSDILLRIGSETPCGTRFPAHRETSPAKRWLASTELTGSKLSAAVVVNHGAAEALLDRSTLTSLLPIGLESIEGTFEQGDVIQIRDPDGKVIGCGRARYDNAYAQSVIGKRGQKPLIHYDYLYTL